MTLTYVYYVRLHTCDIHTHCVHTYSRSAAVLRPCSAYAYNVCVYCMYVIPYTGMAVDEAISYYVYVNVCVYYYVNGS